MQDLQKIGKELARRGKTADIRALAQSADGQKLGALVDPGAVESAAKSGDSEALRRILSDVLSTEEGRRLTEKVQKLMQE